MENCFAFNKVEGRANGWQYLPWLEKGFNHAFFDSSLGDIPQSVKLLKQEHSNIITDSEGEEADGWAIRDLPGVYGIKTADCYPVIIRDESGFLILHCGWRGVASGIIEKALQLSSRQAEAVIGPGISQANYEVSREVFDAVTSNKSFFAETVPGKGKLDLSGVIREKLGPVFRASLDVCTFDSSNCYSYRQNKTERRLLTAATSPGLKFF